MFTMYYSTFFDSPSWVEESWLQLQKRKDMIKKGWQHCMLGSLHDPHFQEEASRMVIERSLFHGQEDCLPSIVAEIQEVEEITFGDIADPEEDIGLEGNFCDLIFILLFWMLHDNC